jgi:hypothetical protein
MGKDQVIAQKALHRHKRPRAVQFFRRLGSQSRPGKKKQHKVFQHVIPIGEQSESLENQAQKSYPLGYKKEYFMTRLTAVFLMLSLSAPAAFAESPQDRMKQCNVDAKGKKGDERKKFMSDCLSAPGSTPVPVPATEPSSPQERMVKCNKEAAGKKGDERKKFMSECLKAN